MYTLHIGNKNYSSWSLRPWLLMTQLSIPFTEQLHPFAEGSNWDTFRAFSPSGLVPCLVDGEQEVWDSLAITEYLAERHAGVWPDDAAARAWARCAAAEMHAGFSVLRNTCPMNVGVRFSLTTVSPALLKDMARLDELWCQGLRQFAGPFLAGESFTAVDAFFVPVAFRIRTYGLKVSAEAQRYCEQLLSLESVKAWEVQALAEPWREQTEENKLRDTGVVLEDFRTD